MSAEKASKKLGPRAALKPLPSREKPPTLPSAANGTSQQVPSPLIKYDDLLVLLTCVQCSKFSNQGTIVHCRKGHVHCTSCKSGQTSCKVCKQTFVDASNVVLDKILSTIALKCAFKEKGCEKFVFPDQKLDHETFCLFRPVSCKFAQQGCEEELCYKNLQEHHKV